jgi:hypothetical protein
MNIFKLILKKFRKLILSDFREEQLSNYFANIISKNISSKKIKILDFGSGFNPKIILKLDNKLRALGYDSKINCVDFYSDDELKVLNSESETISFINFSQFESLENRFDLVIISDVLHHIGIDRLEDEKNLKKAFKSNFILIKDHFEFSLITRYLLIFMDFIGNYKDSVSIPKNYFSHNKYSQFLQANNLEIIDKIENIKLYSFIYFPFNLKKIQFVHLLEQKI